MSGQNVTKENISIEEITKLFQISLALSNHEDSIKYKELYYKSTYELFVEIVFNIEQYECFERFIEQYDVWENALNYEIKKILIAIIFHKQKYIVHWDELITCLNKDSTLLKATKASELISMNMFQLLKHLYITIQKINNSKKIEELTDIGSETNDINLAKKIFRLIEDESDYLKEKVIINIARITSYTNLDEALKLLESVDDFFAYHERYDIAKRLYETDMLKAQQLIDELDEAFQYGFKSYLAILNNDQKTITNIINSLEGMLEMDAISDIDYESTILIIQNEVKEVYPLLNAKLDDMLIYNSSTSNLNCEINITRKYKELYNLQKQNKQVPYEHMYEIASQIMPYMYLDLDVEAKEKYYID